MCLQKNTEKANFFVCVFLFHNHNVFWLLTSYYSYCLKSKIVLLNI